MKKRIGTLVPIGALRSSSRALAAEARGTFATAKVFLAWLKRTGQGGWQLLPIAETHLEPGSAATRVPSPYKGYGIGLDPACLAAPWSELRPSAEALRDFREEHAAWLSDHALFCALRDRFGTDDWTVWDADIRARGPEALDRWSEALRAEIEAYVLTQWRLHAALKDLREEARRSDIRLIGDMPFYLPLRCPLVWAHRGAFDIDEDGRMRAVSGVLDGPNAHYGRQVWGHPLYLWDRHESREELTALWKTRLAHAAGIYDDVRLDHAKGFYFFGAMAPERPGDDEVRAGPGSAVLTELIAHCRGLGLGLYAEDAGDRLEELRETLRAEGIPGIRILRHAYNEKKKRIEEDYAHPDRYPSDAFAYTSTHDTVTLIGYARALSAEERRLLAEHVGIEATMDDLAFTRRLRAAALGSSAGTVIIPLQDWLLTDERINVPGTEKAVGDPNWHYRMSVPIEDLPDAPSL